MNTLNGDNFYEYFMRVVESGARHYGQKNMALIKIIDEKWVEEIEKVLIPLETIIKRPRKFIKREENIVPIELARKVGSDAVKHLATHTHFISRIDKNNNVIPNKILNVYNDESLEIYENRFIITLISRIGQFLDRRYEALFGTTGDEFESVLKIDSTFNDYDEKIEYNLVLKLHQGQNYLDNTNNDPQIYKRIEHIKTMINGYKKTEFYINLAGCNQVKSPISQTNLIMKEPNFKACYTLWNFLEKYTEAGYTIEKHEIDGNFDHKYLDELNTLVLYNYLIMKNHLENEHNKAVDISLAKKKRVIKPKFITNIIEELISDYDIPENELKLVFDKEISRAYTAKVDKEEEIKLALQKALSNEIGKKQEVKQEEQIKSLLEKALATETEKKDKEKEEDAILSALEKALGAEIEKNEKKKEEESILGALELALNKSEQKKQEDTIAEVLMRALGKEED